jgi:hypothetical protein
MMQDELSGWRRFKEGKLIKDEEEGNCQGGEIYNF